MLRLFSSLYLPLTSDTRNSKFVSSGFLPTGHNRNEGSGRNGSQNQDRSSAHAEFQSTKARESFDEGILSSLQALANDPFLFLSDP